MLYEGINLLIVVRILEYSVIPFERLYRKIGKLYHVDFRC